MTTWFSTSVARLTVLKDVKNHAMTRLRAYKSGLGTAVTYKARLVSAMLSAHSSGQISDIFKQISCLYVPSCIWSDIITVHVREKPA